MENMEMYCLKCREQRDCEVVGESVTKNNRKIYYGQCPVCEGNTSRIGGKA